MSEIKLFRITGQNAAEVATRAGGLEKSLQVLIEKNLDGMFGVRFLYSEFSTGKNHGGKIDTLGLDEDGSPVIIEYKRAVNENVINQGLFYLDWLLDHKAEFKLLVMEALGKKAADEIEWTGPRLICIAADFTKYDQHAVRQINRNIDLVRYRHFGTDFLALELVHRTSASGAADGDGPPPSKGAKKTGDKPVSQALADMDPAMRDLYEAMRSFLLALGDDVQEKQLKLYMTYRRIKNFAAIIVQKKALVIMAKLNPDTVTLEPGFTKDMRKIGHWATGDLEIIIKNRDDLLKAEPLLARAYAES